MPRPKTSTTKNARRTGRTGLARLVKLFNMQTNRGRLMSFVLLFALVGGGYLAYEAFAARARSGQARLSIDNMRRSVILPSIRAPADGVVGEVRCVGVAAVIAGPRRERHLAHCVQIGPNNQRRVGTYDIRTRIFTPTTGWLDNHGMGQRARGPHLPHHLHACPNMRNWFTTPTDGNGAHLRHGKPLNTRFGGVHFGQIYQQGADGVWRIRFANLNVITGNCYPSGQWHRAVAW